MQFIGTLGLETKALAAKSDLKTYDWKSHLLKGYSFVVVDLKTNLLRNFTSSQKIKRKKNKKDFKHNLLSVVI